MPNRIRTEFLGLNGVIPNHRTSEAEADSFLVALPDLAYGWRDVNLHHEQKDELPGVIAPHVAAVIVPTESVVHEFGKKAAMTFRSRSGDFAGRECSMYVFDQERLSLSELEGGALDFSVNPVKAGDIDSEVPMTSEDEHGLQWIPRLSLANENLDRRTGMFDRGRFLHSDLTPRATGDLQLAGTIVLDGGQFYAEDVIRSNGEAVRYDYHPPHRTNVEWRQSHYTRLLWDGQFTGDCLNLKFASHDNSKEALVAVRPENGCCDMWIVNLELDALLDVGSGVPEHTPADFDFSVLYLYSTDVPTKDQGLPVLHENRNFMGGIMPRCQSGMFDGLG